MSQSSSSSMRAPRVGVSLGKLKSAHLAAIIGVKSLVAFRDFAVEAAADAADDQPPLARPLPPVPEPPFRVLWSEDKRRVYRLAQG